MANNATAALQTAANLFADTLTRLTGALAQAATPLIATAGALNTSLLGVGSSAARRRRAGRDLPGIPLLGSAFPAANIPASSTAEIAMKMGRNGEDGGERPSGGEEPDARLGNRCCPS